MIPLYTTLAPSPCELRMRTAAYELRLNYDVLTLTLFISPNSCTNPSQPSKSVKDPPALLPPPAHVLSLDADEIKAALRRFENESDSVKDEIRAIKQARSNSDHTYIHACIHTYMHTCIHTYH